MSYIKELKSGINLCHTSDEKEKGLYTMKGGSKWLNRFEYKGHYSEIDSGRRLRALLREGQYSFPGGYAIVAYTGCGAAVCNDCIKDNLSSVLWSIHNDVNDGWRVAYLDIYYGIEDNGETMCDNCGKDWEAI